MRKALLTGAVLLLGTALIFAQDTTSGSSGQGGASASSQNGSTENTNQTGSTTTQQTTTTTSTTQTSGSNAVQGCLTGSSGNYMLTNGMGVSYQLLGSDSQLSANVNKQVEVMGTPSSTSSASASTSPNAGTGASTGSATSSPDAGMAGSSTAHATANSTKTIEVTSVRKIADRCSNANQTAPQQ